MMDREILTNSDAFPRFDIKGDSFEYLYTVQGIVGVQVADHELSILWPIGVVFVRIDFLVLQLDLLFDDEILLDTLKARGLISLNHI